MRLVKIATLALAALTFVTTGCASETSTGESSESGEREDRAAPSSSEGASKDLTSAELPSSANADDDAKGTPPSVAAGDADPSTVVPDTDTEFDDDDEAPPPAPGAAPAPPTVAPKPADPGPKPAGTCSVSKDALGFFTRNSGKSEYVAYVPASYSSSKPMRLIVGLHGCSDTALNFAKWGVNPWDTRATQQHIGISIGGESGSNKCWKMGVDDEKVLAAVDDIAKCFWVDRAKVVVAGYSSGGQLAYRVGLKNADKLAGILIENSGLYAAGDTPANLTKNAARKLPIAHSANTGDTVFPIAKVEADWSVLTSAGFPLKSRKQAGPHNGDGKTWATWLIPASAGWTKPASN